VKLFCLIITLTLAACQTTLVTPTISSDSAPESPTPRPALILAPTQTPRPIEAMPMLVASPVQSTAIISGDTPIPAASDTPFIVIVTATPVSVASVPTSPPAAPFINTNADVLIGLSIQGREINVRRFGTGSRVLLLVGGMHGGYEANTIDLMDALIAHFAATPTDVLPGMSIHIVRAANPDGLATGRTFDGRFNANGVDLNRNWGCDWSADAVWRTTPVSAGAHPFSEPETSALAAYIQSIRPAAALFYHSSAGGVFAGNCREAAFTFTGRSNMLAQVVGEAAGYSWGSAFTAYPVSGTAPEWVDGIGIPSADVELLSDDDPEFERNLRAIIAAQEWLLSLP